MKYIAFVVIIIALAGILVCCNENNPNALEGMNDYPHSYPPENVHLFMTFDKVYAEKVGNNTSTINEKYAKKHGFHFHKVIIDLDKNKRLNYEIGNRKYKTVPHFGRYLTLLDLSKNFPPDHIFIYIDSDAAIYNENLDIRTWIPPNPQTYILFGNEFSTIETRVTSTLRRIVYGITMNSGFFIARNNSWVKAFLFLILTSDKCKETRIQTQTASTLYDQACISTLYKKNKHREKEHIKVIPNKNKVQTCDPHNLVRTTLILHTAGKNHKNYYQTINPQNPFTSSPA